jgi:DNA polymerase III subunit beta
MKLSIERVALLTALAHVQSVVERRNTIPILSNVHLNAADGGLALTATDLDIAIVEKVTATVSRAGATTVPAHTLYDIVRKLPDGAEIELTQKPGDSRLQLRAGRSEFTLACLPKEDFPVMAAGDLPASFNIAAADLRRLIDKTRFAISTEETRYYLNGIYVHAAQSTGVPVLRAVATDGHRLARVETPLPDGAAAMPGVIVPRKTVNELRKLIDSVDGDVDVALSDTKIRFSVAEASLTSKLIDGQFPDYERVIPPDNPKALAIQAADLAQAVDRVSTISSERSRAVKLALDKDRLLVSATSPENGTAVEELTAAYNEGALEIGFNSRYLLDIMDQVEKGGEARFALKDSGSPTVVRDASDEGALFVIMPMRV